MKKLASIILISLFIVSCDRGVIGSLTEYTLVNSTPCSVEVTGYLNGEILDSYFIDENSSFDTSFSSSDPAQYVYPPPFEPYADSCLVVYCNQDSIIHLRSYGEFDLSSPIKSLFDEDDYEIETSGERVSYTFEFTEEDYERAKIQ